MKYISCVQLILTKQRGMEIIYDLRIIGVLSKG